MALMIGPTEAFSVWLMTLFFGLSGAGLPLGVPPLPEDPAISRTAPEECLWYFSSAGMATPDPASGNQTEQLFAEPELQQLVKTVEDQVLRAIRREVRGRQDRILAEELPALVKAALTRPLAIYIAEIRFPTPGNSPKVRAGLVCNLGDQANALEQSLDRLMHLIPEDGNESTGSPWRHVPLPPPHAPPVHWTVDHGYLIIAVGEEEGEAILERLASPAAAPSWHQEIRSDFEPDRISTIGYLNVAGLIESLGPMLEEHARALSLFGFDNVQAVSTLSGLDDIACTSRVKITLDGEPRGVFSLLPQDPLSKRDLEQIPGDATAALAVRVDPEKTFRRILDIFEAFDPRAREEFEEALRDIEQDINTDIRRDVIAALDDIGIIYMPGGEMISSWIGASAMIKIKDRDQLEGSFRRLATRMEVELGRHARRGGPVVRQMPYAGQTIHFLSVPDDDMPFAPAWCFTEDYLIIGLMPQTIKSYLDRDEEIPTLADIPEVATSLAQGTGPACISYIDMERIVRGIYPWLQIGVRMASVELQREGIDIDVSILPDMESIARHFVPGTSTWTKTGDGFQFETRQTLPGGGNIVSTAPIVAAMLLPVVQSARSTSGEVQEMNNLKQLALAFHNYADSHKRFPSNIYDEDGKPLLSWRVALLPYLEESALYEEFHLDEPWDSEHNQALIPRMPLSLTARNEPVPPGRTLYVALAGEKTLFPGNEKLSFRHVVDGTSSTLMFVRAAPQAAVIWTKPEDIAFDPKHPKQGLGSLRGRCLAAVADGSVHLLNLDLPDAIFTSLATRDGAEVIDWQEIHRMSQP
ncbi:MAG: DUF1559 domain-containing protein [Pirellulales bacterium]|nr:DUF1559 domain-containing protein [Pirellulales bacterium]